MPRKSSKSHILETAESLFAARGIENISLRHINEATGLSPAAVHYHFKNKENLLTAILLRDGRAAAQRDSIAQDIERGQLALNKRNFIIAMMQPLETRFLEDGISGQHFTKIIAQIYAHKHHEYKDLLPDEFQQISKRARSLLLKLKSGEEITSALLSYSFLSIAWVEALASFDAITPIAKTEAELLEQKTYYIKQLREFLTQAL